MLDNLKTTEEQRHAQHIEVGAERIKQLHRHAFRVGQTFEIALCGK